jgi:tetratricopeptide (TPR) repeat protein
VFGLCSICALAADEVQESTKLFRQGSHAQALDRINAFLNTNPKDAKARFLKGIILTEQGKSADAIKIFTALTEDFPELPEPYNNLAVLYAQQGQYDKARTALEMAIRTHPSYATAHENLGDIYAKMASQAYDKALQLDKNNTGAQTKLELIKDLFTNSPRTSRSVSRPEAGKPTVAAAPAQKPALAPAKPVAEPAKPAAEPVKPESAKPAAEPPKPSAQVEPPTAEPRAKPAPAPEGSEDVLRAVRAWAKAWSNNDVPGYLAFYAPDFKTPGGEGRAAWEQARTARIAKPRKIELTIQSPQVKLTDGRAIVTFRQGYRSGGLSVSSNKTLVMVKSGGKWLIQEEKVGK